MIETTPYYITEETLTVAFQTTLTSMNCGQIQEGGKEEKNID
jgi:hypothetical protein